MSDDPWAQFIVPADQGSPSPASSAPAPAAVAPTPQSSAPTQGAAPANDPWAAFIVPDAPKAAGGITGDVGYADPSTFAGAPTPKNDPIFHGAQPVAQAPDQGALTAFATGAGGVPVIGPYIERGLEAAAAGARSLMSGTSYADERQHVQDMVDASREQHPYAAAAGDFTGASTALAPVIAAAPAAFGAGPGGLTLGKIATGAMTGGALGGADAAVRSGGDLDASIIGGFGGAAFGAAGPVAGSVLARGAGIVGNAVGRAISPNTGVSPAVADIISRTVQNDGMAGYPAMARIAGAGPDGMMVDAAPNLAHVLDTSTQRGGPGSLAARQAIEGRAAAANQDMTTALDNSLGQPQGIETTAADIRNSTAAARDAAYRTAYATPIDYSSQPGRALDDMIRTRVPQGVINRAVGQMRMDGIEPRPIRMARIQPNGGVQYEDLPGTQLVDYITRSLNDVARAGDGQGALGGNTSEGRSYGVLARELRDALRAAVPEYGSALDTAAQPIQARNALEFGATLLKPNVPRDVAAETIRTMTQPELAQVRAGVRGTIAEALSNVSRTIGDPNVDARQAMAAVKALSSPAAQEKLGLLMGERERAAMATGLARATQSLELRGASAGNSRTFARSVTNEAINQAAQPNIAARSLTSGGPMKATRPIFEALLGIRPEDLTRRADVLHGELANTLTGPRGPAAMDMLERIMAAHGRQQAVSSIAGSIPYTPLAQTGLLSALTALQQRSH